ncbi:MAG: flotillin-like protein FloA [Planctomycetota bacterium]
MYLFLSFLLQNELPAEYSDIVSVIVVGGGVFVAIIFGLLFLNYGLIWIQALTSGCPVSIFTLVAMRFRQVNPNILINSLIMATKAGLKLNVNHLEAHYLAKGNVPNIIRALIAADRARIKLDFPLACAIDLAGRDILDAVQTSVNPKVINCPDEAKGKYTIDAMAKDGIQIKVRARVTVRSSIERLIGGAVEETIIARVGEGIVSTIGSAEDYKVVLENPDRISKTVLSKSLDSNTAFEILSIDIAEVIVGENIGAKLRIDQANAQKRVAQANAEKRRAMAVAAEQEMDALIRESHVKVVLAEADVPKAIAKALQTGTISLMDYYKLKNLQADTAMRSAIAMKEE